MLYNELKHTPNGRYKLKWQWGLPPASHPQEYKWFRWLHFDSMQDLNEFLERYVKVHFPEEKYEIEDTLEELHRAQPSDNKLD